MKKKQNSQIKVRILQIKNKIVMLYEDAKNKIGKSIKLEIVTVVVVALFIATVVGVLTASVSENMGIGRRYYTSYTENKKVLQERLVEYVQRINQLDESEIAITVDADAIREIIDRYDKAEASQLLLRYIKEEMQERGYELDYAYENQKTNNYDKIIEKINNSKLYDELKKLSDSGAWYDELVEQKIKEVVDFGEIVQQIRENTIRQVISELTYDFDGYVMQSQTYLVNSEGNALYQEGFVQQIDIAGAIQRAGNDNEEQVTSVFPVIIGEDIGYLINESVLRGRMIEYYSDTARALGWVAGAVSFVLLMFKFTKAKIRYIEYISYCLTEISKGNLHYKVEVVGEDELAQVATDIAHMEEEIRRQIEAQKQAEKVKNELITNVAHDLRTPLTSIIGYVGLLKDGKFENEDERKKYIEIAYQKSEKLKGLIEDLFEYTKLHNQEATLKMESISLTHLLNQLAEELMPLGEERGITISTHIHTDQTRITGDIQKLMRAFENLIGNAIKYSLKDQEVQIQVAEDGDYVIVAIQNKCEHMPEGDLNKLFDRFYRSDASRNSETGGSGLGLAIAKNIVLLHGGQIWAQSKDNLISFNMRLRK